MRSYFQELLKYAFDQITPSEILLIDLEGENSDFVRFNHAQVRQSGSVSQVYLTLQLINGKRHLSHSISLTLDKALDRESINEQIKNMQETMEAIEEDPYLLISTQNRSSEDIIDSSLPSTTQMVEEIIAAVKGGDLTGILSSGDMFFGFASSFGQINWFQRSSFNFDWSVYFQTDKAVKSSYAGFTWDSAVFISKMDSVLKQLEIMKRDVKVLSPGKYRVYLAPAAMRDFLGLLNWGGFGIKAWKTKSTPLLKLVEDNEKLNPLINIIENTKQGVSPNFQREGFIRPDSISLIKEGRLDEAMVSPRSAIEFDLAQNGCDFNEMPLSVDMAAGTIDESDILNTLGTGIYINNVHYLNFSDRPECRITGMTRFACFWVEEGKIIAPINVMRFDETIYHILGDHLVGLTSNREFIISPGTYESREVSSCHLPGAIVEDFEFTL